MPSPIRVLYAEDDADTREMMCMILEAEGFEVSCPETPTRFLQTAKDGQIDVFLLDWWMPEISGIALCKAIREFDSYTPIIFYSAAAYEKDVEAARAAGAQSYIRKPCPFEELIAEIRAVVARGVV